MFQTRAGRVLAKSLALYEICCLLGEMLRTSVNNSHIFMMDTALSLCDPILFRYILTLKLGTIKALARTFLSKAIFRMSTILFLSQKPLPIPTITPNHHFSSCLLKLRENLASPIKPSQNQHTCKTIPEITNLYSL